jgi:hypothetical protein
MSLPSETSLTVRQAYLVMFEFLRQHYERGPTDEIGGLLGGLSLLRDGEPADAAMLGDFERAVAAVIAAEAKQSGYREADLELGSGGSA